MYICTICSPYGFTRKKGTHSQKEGGLVNFADDFIACFREKEDAENLMMV